MKSESIFFTAGVFVAALVLTVVAFSLDGKDINPTGSVTQGNEYTSTTTDSTAAGTHWVARTVNGGSSCVLGSIVVASTTSTSDFRIWNATSTTDIASTTLVYLPISAGAGTYIYDVVCSRGLIIDTPTGFTGSYTITYR